MSDLLYSEEQGRYYVRLPGNRYMPLENEDQARAVQETGVEAFVNSLGNTIGQTITGAGALAGDPGAKRAYDILSGTQQARAENAPVAGTTGALVPDIAAGVATGFSGPLLRRAGLTAAVEGGLGAAQNPDDPATGAAIGATAGAIGGGAAGIISSGAQKGVTLANTITGNTRRTRSLSAAGTPGDEVNYGRTERELRGFLTAERADELKIRLTPGERMALEATDADQLAQANKIRDLEDLGTSTRVTGTPFQIGDMPGIDRFARQDQREWFTSYLGDVLDEPNVDTLTRKRLGDILEDTQDVFKRYIDNLNEPIPADEVIEKTADIAEAVGPSGSAQLARLAKKVEELGEGGTFKPQATQSLMTATRKQMQSAFDAGNYELGQALSQVNDALQDAVVKVAESVNPGAAVEIKIARKKYGIIKALQRGKAVDPGGIINPASFKHNYAKTNRRYATGKADDEFAQVLDTINYLTSRQTGDSGTAARLAAGTVGMIPAGALVLGGGNALLNN